MGRSPNAPLEATLLDVALRRLIAASRDRSSTADKRDARVYRQVEPAATAVIAGHAEMRAVWSAARGDLVRALVGALDEPDQAGA